MYCCRIERCTWSDLSAERRGPERSNELMPTLFITIALAALNAQNVPRGAAIPAKIESFLRNCETNRRGAILQLEHTLRGLQNQADQTPQVASRIKAIEGDLQVLKANKQPIVSTLSFPPEVGTIGRVPRLSWHIDQIVSDREMIVRCYFHVRTTAVRRFVPRGEIKVQPVSFIVRGVETKNLLEGSDPPAPQVFEITGRETYSLARGGSTSVWVLEPFDMAAALAYFPLPGPQ
jgi:hypothetical protein